MVSASPEGRYCFRIFYEAHGQGHLHHNVVELKDFSYSHSDRKISHILKRWFSALHVQDSISEWICFCPFYPYSCRKENCLSPDLLKLISPLIISQISLHRVTRVFLFTCKYSLIIKLNLINASWIIFHSIKTEYLRYVSQSCNPRLLIHQFWFSQQKVLLCERYSSLLFPAQPELLSLCALAFCHVATN